MGLRWWAAHGTPAEALAHRKVRSRPPRSAQKPMIEIDDLLEGRF
jgi:hypothetical protein